MDNEPFTVDSELEEKLQQYIMIPIENPQLWHPQLVPMQKLTYVFGLEGSRCLQQILAFFALKGVKTESWDGGKLKNSRSPRVLIVHLTANLVKNNVHLEEKCGKNDFVIVLGNIPFQPSIPFFGQFQQHVLVQPLTSDYALDIIKFRCEQFYKHINRDGTRLDFKLSETDWENLKSACIHVTYQDVVQFCARLFAYCIRESSLENPLDVTHQLLHDANNKIMFSPHGNGIMCITQHDPVEKFKEFCQKSGISYDNLPSLKSKEEAVTEDSFFGSPLKKRKIEED